MNSKQFLDILGLGEDATWSEIKTAYFLQMQSRHPNRYRWDPGNYRRSLEKARIMSTAFESLRQAMNKDDAVPLALRSEYFRFRQEPFVALPESPVAAPYDSPLLKWCRSVGASALLVTLSLIVLMLLLEASHRSPHPGQELAQTLLERQFNFTVGGR